MELLSYIIKAPAALGTLLIMIIFKLRPPKRINSLYGYRTNNSMKNEKNWEIAQRLSANLGIRYMCTLVFIQVLIFFVAREYISSTHFLILWLLSVVTLIGVVEKKLKQRD